MIGYTWEGCFNFYVNGVGANIVINSLGGLVGDFNSLGG